MPNEPRADNGDSCCHEIGLCLTDECTALDKPLHGWIESDLLHLVRGTRVHRSMTVVKIVHLLATRFGQVTPSSLRCWSQQSRISAPNSSCGQTSTARHESCCRNGQPRRWSAPASEELAKEGGLSTALITCFCPHLESCALPEKKSCKRRNDPVSFITVNCADVCVVRSTLGFSVTASASCELEAESVVASSFSATKLSLDW